VILSTLQQLVADFVGDPNQTRFSATQYVDAINRAQEQFILDSKSLFKYATHTSTAGTSTYSLTTDFLLEESITYNGIYLKPVSRRTLAVLYPDTDWTLLEGTPTMYMIDPEQINRVFRLIPIPQEAKTVVLKYLALPSEVSAATDVVLNAATLMTQFHMGVAAFAAWILLNYETATPEIVEKKREMQKIYQDYVNKAIENYGNTKSEPLRFRPIK